MTTLDGTWTYTYDAIGQLTRLVFASTDRPSRPDLQLRRDGQPHPDDHNGVTTTYTTNNLNQYTTVGRHDLHLRRRTAT